MPQFSTARGGSHRVAGLLISVLSNYTEGGKMDQLILEEASRRLHARSSNFARAVRCRCDHGVLRLTGRVPTFYLKQTAQSLVRGIEGIERIENELVVASPTGAGAGSERPAAAAP